MVPVSAVLDTLDEAFYVTFKNVEPCNKPVLLALDVSVSVAGSLHRQPAAPPRPSSLHEPQRCYSAGWPAARRAVDRVLILSRYLGHGHVEDAYWYLTASPRLFADAGDRIAVRCGMKTPELIPWLQRFFREHLLTQRNVSPATIAAYRDTFRLLLRYVRDRAQHCFSLPLDTLTPDMIVQSP